MSCKRTGKLLLRLRKDYGKILNFAGKKVFTADAKEKKLLQQVPYRPAVVLGGRK
jgi:hypothetical protein